MTITIEGTIIEARFARTQTMHLQRESDGIIFRCFATDDQMRSHIERLSPACLLPLVRAVIEQRKGRWWLVSLKAR